jgi:hypothetical protein
VLGAVGIEIAGAYGLEPGEALRCKRDSKAKPKVLLLERMKRDGGDLAMVFR